ncbi:MAG: tRNA 2-thiouridine(34) synthase MnmA [Desulfobacterales bacterium]
MTEFAPKIAVALSGGIDSLTAAFLLRQNEEEVIGIHFRTGYEPYPESRSRAKAEALSRLLGIPVYFENLHREFQRVVVDDFVSGYRAGLTPNPCVVCNPEIKFGVLLDRARRHGAGRLATGHYAAVRRDLSGRFRLYKGKDTAKDQSYFLFALRQEQLARACFPLAQMTKQEVCLLAAEKRLEPLEKEESQDVCFIAGEEYTEFLQRCEPGILQPGPITTPDGRVIGEHPGIAAFTIGQRRGIQCPAAAPYYVVRKEPDTRRLVVGHREDLYAAGCRVVRVNWVALRPEGPRSAGVRLRYRSPETAARLVPSSPDFSEMDVFFDSPQPAVAPGQAAVFYEGDEVLGGGFIASTYPAGPVSPPPGKS